jgi:hypothetical protein
MMVKNSMRQLLYLTFVGVSMMAAAASVCAASLSDSSPYDRNAACTERSEGPEPDFCTLYDGPPPRQYLRRYRQPVINGPGPVNGSSVNTGSMSSGGQQVSPPVPAQPGTRQ